MKETKPNIFVENEKNVFGVERSTVFREKNICPAAKHRSVMLLTCSEANGMGNRINTITAGKLKVLPWPNLLLYQHRHLCRDLISKVLDSPEMLVLGD